MYKLFNSIYNSIRGAKKMKKTYTIIIHKEADGYWGECKELNGCFAQAKTVNELIKLMQKAIYMYFENIYPAMFLAILKQLEIDTNDFINFINKA